MLIENGSHAPIYNFHRLQEHLMSVIRIARQCIFAFLVNHLVIYHNK